MKVVFTGFGPFGDVTYNPSWDCAQAAARSTSASAELLPVTVQAARDFVEDLPADALLVSFGVAASRQHVCLERFAHNWWKDLGEEVPTRLSRGESPALECALPLDEWALAMTDDEMKYVVSHDAGTYVCNALLYTALAKTPNAVFVHVPPVGTELAAKIGRRVAEVVGEWLTRADDRGHPK